MDSATKKSGTELKIIVVGNSGTGKTSFVNKWVKNIFTDNYKATIEYRDGTFKDVEIPFTAQVNYGKYANVELPKPYSSSELPCTSTNCATKKLVWMSCTVQSVALRTAYEAINIPVLLIAKITWATCGCFEIKGKIKCMLVRSYPGIPCNVMSLSLKSITKISFNIWKAYFRKHV